MNTTHALLDAATAALEKGQWAEAKARSLDFLEANPRSAEGFLALSAALVSLSELDKGLLAVAQAIELDANHASGYYLLGVVLEALDQPRYAERAFASVLQLDPEHPSALAHRLACRGRQSAHPLADSEAQLIEQLLARLYPSISACLIVKNEAANLGRCLESLKGWVNEIVVVDTGSTDETVAIAERYGAKVGHFDWCDDFSAARNASLALATSDWVLTIDADEELQVADHLAWTQALRRREFGAYVVYQTNLRDDGQVENEAPVMRLFQRADAIRFSGRLHEVVGPSVEALGWPHAELPIVRLRHTGYQSAAMAAQAKGQRNLAIALKAAEERPDDVFAVLQVARAYCFNHQPAEALPVLDRLSGLPGLADLPLAHWANYVSMYAEVLQTAGRFQDAEGLLTQALGRLADFPEFLFDRGRIRFRLGDVAGARADFERCVAMHGRPFTLASRPGVTDQLPRQALAELAGAAAQPVRPTVSACLIVKNEAANLGRCLESLKGWVDEIVVVDTGSTDETVAIAERYGATIGHFDWCDDFSAARNASLALATSDWVLVIDADEELQVAHPDHWAQVLSGPATGVILTQANVDAQGRVETETPALRLFKRDARIRFAGRLHESVLASIQAFGGLVAEAPFLKLRHGGYIEARVEATGKGARNVRLAELAAAERPDAPEVWLDLARSHAFNQEPASALAAFERLMALEGGLEALDEPRWAAAVQSLQATYQALGRHDEAERVLDRALDRLPGYPEFHFERAALRLRRDDRPAAAADFRACLAAHGRSFTLPVRPGLTDTLPARALAVLERPTVSACLIVKNEAANLGRCLESLKGWVDEIVVVDTGSTDETVAIAERCGATIGHFAWCDDFSAARNASLELATSDWVLVIDADEQLQVTDPDAWARSLSLTERGYGMNLSNVGSTGQVESRTVTLPRLFRRHAEVRFRGRLHESTREALESLGWGIETLQGAWIRHAGSTDDAIAGRDKIARNRQLAERMIADEPGNPDGWFFLANTCWLAKDAKATLAALGELRRLAQALPAHQQRTALLVEAWALSAEGRATEALTVLDAGLALAPGFPEYLYERGRLRASLGQTEAAIADFEACLAAPRGALPAREGITGYMAHAELAELRLRQQRPDLAAQHLRAAAQDPACPAEEAARLRQVADMLPAAPEARGQGIDAATTALEKGQWAEAKARSLDFLEATPRSAEGFLALSTALVSMGELDKGLLAVAQAIELDANQASGYYLLGVVLEALDQPRYAERAFASVLQLDPEHPSALAHRLACRGRQSAHPLADSEAQLIEQLLARLYPSISACLIVKNEAANLGRCLDSLKGWVNEIVVVDTGSTDETVAIAERYGATIGHFDWCDDFSAARNASLALATSDWVLTIDADEELQVADHLAWTQALRRREFGAYVIDQRNRQDRDVVLANPLVRIFQRNDAIRYQGRLHEDVTRSIAALGWPITDLPEAHLDHDGYMREQVEAKDKWGRNFRLALAEVEAHPEDMVAWYNLGRSALFLGQDDAAVSAFAQVDRLRKAGAELGESRFCTFVVLYQQLLARTGQADRAIALLDEGLARVSGFPEFLYERGLLRAAQGDLAGARADLESCMRPQERRYLAALRDGITDALPRQALERLLGQAIH